MVSLGGLITCDGRANVEVIRRVGEGRALFKQLQKIWSHANITTSRKVAIYQSCIVSKVLHSLESLWLLKADRDRIDAFHSNCIRRILRIPHSFISRVSNQVVLEKAGVGRLSSLLERRQVALFKRIQQLPADNVLRSLVCNPSGEPVLWCQRRRQGRPRQVWAHSVHKVLESIL